MPNKLSKPDFEEVLTDVRSAYRLVYLYQRKVLDVVRIIGNKLQFSYHRGYPKFSDPSITRGKEGLDDWAWDWLNLYLYEFNFETKELDKHKIDFSVVLQSDSGAYLSGAEATDIEKFESPGRSSSRLFFITGKNYWEDVDGIIEELAKNSECVEEIRMKRNAGMLFKSYDLKEFMNEEKIDRSVEAFINLCTKNNIPIR